MVMESIVVVLVPMPGHATHLHSNCLPNCQFSPNLYRSIHCNLCWFVLSLSLCASHLFFAVTIVHALSIALALGWLFWLLCSALAMCSKNPVVVPRSFCEA